MGAGYHGGFGNTKGNRDRKEQEKQTLIQELKSKGIKFTEQDIVFITKDKTGQTIWLEKGSASAGLQHIIQRHENDFIKKLGVGKEQIPSVIQEIITYGTLEYSRRKTINGKDGFEKMYKHQNRYYFLSAVGINGFIVSIYPQNERDAQALIRRYKNNG